VGETHFVDREERRAVEIAEMRRGDAFRRPLRPNERRERRNASRTRLLPSQPLTSAGQAANAGIDSAITAA
jgi:hypothetical protein